MYCDTGLGDVRLQKSQSVLLNRKRYQCQNYFSTTFTKCAMKNMAKMLSEAAIDCVTPYWASGTKGYIAKTLIKAAKCYKLFLPTFTLVWRSTFTIVP